MNVKRWTALCLVLSLALGALPRSVLAQEPSAEDASVSAVTQEQEMSEASEPAAEESAQPEAEPADSAEESVQPEEEPVPAEESAPVRAAPVEEYPDESAPSEDAAEAEGGQGLVEGTITGFADEGVLLRLTISEDARPGLKELLQKLPEELSVQVGKVTCAIPVTWSCVGDDYEAGESYYYQFSPQWDETRWPLAQGVDRLEDAPYAAVFVSLSGVDTQSAQSVEVQCYRFFTENMGLNTAAACGILANIYNECGFKPNNLQQSFEKKLGYTDESYTEAVDNGTYKNFVHDSAGYGLFQFTWWSLKRDVLAYAKKKGTSIGDPLTQLEYVRDSLGDTRTKKLKSFPNTAKGAYDAGKYFCDYYEKPGLKDQPVARAKLARDTFWPRYKDAYSRAESGVADALSAPVPVSLEQTSRGLRFTWEAVAGATQYRVFSGEGGAWTKLGDTKELSWTQESLTSGKSYSFTVCCLNTKGQQVSDYDPNGLSHSFWAAPALTACKNTAEGIRLDWKAEPCPGYLVCRKEPGGKWGTPVSVTGTSWTDTQAEPGKGYVYAVRCADENGKRLSSYIASEKVIRLTTPVLRGAWNRDKGIELAWKGVVGSRGYRIYRKDAKGKWQCVATLKSGKNRSWVDTSVQKKYGSLCRYTVRALNGSVLSGYDAQGQSCCRLGAPALTQAKSAKGGKLSLSWKKSAKAQGYELLWKSGKTQQTVTLKGAGKLSHTLKGLKKGKVQVKVRAWRKRGGQLYYSDWSEGKKVKL